jgi:hypothetical protein
MTGLVFTLVLISGLAPFMIAGDDFVDRVARPVNQGVVPPMTLKLIVASVIGSGFWLLALLISFARTGQKR